MKTLLQSLVLGVGIACLVPAPGQAAVGVSCQLLGLLVSTLHPSKTASL
jgi:hypothetical protein